MIGPFHGFPRETPRFLEELARNNNRPWFEENKDRYTRCMKEPAAEFARALEIKIRKTFPGQGPLKAKIFRVHRDIRFSRDKTPYKAHIGIRFSEESAKGCADPFFYVQIAAKELWLVTGIKEFEREEVVRFRAALADPVRSASLTRTLARLSSLGMEPQGEKYKRLPPGVDAGAPIAELAKHKGLYVEESLPLPEALYEPGFPEYCALRFKRAKPLYDWLKAL